MNLDLTGKTALITAATSGIGLAATEALAGQGAQVWMNGRSKEHLEAAANTVRKNVPGAQLGLVVGDVSTVEGVKAITDAVADLDILVNMAGGTEYLAPFVELSDADWQYQWDFNVMSGVRLTRHYIPAFLEKDFGRILFLASDAGVITPANLVNYGVVKAAVIRLSRCVAEIFAGTNVTVNCVMPGPTISDWVFRTAGDQPLEEFERAYFPVNQPNSLLKRFAEASEVANLITYLCSPASSATRGATLRVEGGIIRTSI
ncbi:MAG TPA: SDR family oxidoreductase [Acidimicrobiales bacterium]|nr:SDR family oxidoreductase [Acidimicrobiales bacterium]